MNGRIYDPKLGRMLQADPFIQSPTNSQSLNRYSYVLNNPLSYTDPSGYFSFSRFIKKWGRMIVAAVATYFTAGAASTWASGWALASGYSASAAGVIGAVAGGAAAGFVGGGILTGTLKGAFYGGLTGAALGGIGATGWNNVAKSLASGAASGITSELQGGKFGHGFMSAGMGFWTGLKFGGPPEFGKFLASALAGGTISQITGGKFANGAVSAGLAYVVAAAGARSIPRNPDSASNTDLARRQELALAEVAQKFESGALDTSRAFDTANAAAKEALSVLGPISETHQVELGGFISGSKGSYSYGQIFVGTDNSLPALVNVPHSAVAGFHTHPDGAWYFSLSDARWVNGSNGTGIPLYVWGGGQTRICGVSSPVCHPGLARGQSENRYNPALQGRVVQ